MNLKITGIVSVLALTAMTFAAPEAAPAKTEAAPTTEAAAPATNETAATPEASPANTAEPTAEPAAETAAKTAWDHSNDATTVTFTEEQKTCLKAADDILISFAFTAIFANILIVLESFQIFFWYKLTIIFKVFLANFLLESSNNFSQKFCIFLLVLISELLKL